MKISIITVYNSLNSGSFLQAFTLLKKLEEKGHEVNMVKTNARNPLKDIFLISIKSVLKGDIENTKHIIKKYIKFNKEIKKFPTISLNSKALNHQDFFILGSDEIWNIKRDSINKYPIFWGIGLGEKKIISYAPSINRSTIEDLRKFSYINYALNNIEHISVRDNHSKDSISKLTNKEVSLVLDPTLLFDETFYKNYEVPIEKTEKYILVYTYSNHFTPKQISDIKAYAVSNELKLISINHRMEWCDKSIPVSPFEFLSYCRNASAVITDTFHGTVFSIIYKNRFLTYADDNTKIIDLLSRIGLESQNYKLNDNATDFLDRDINYEIIFDKIRYLRNESNNFLDEALNDLQKIKGIIR